MPACVSPARRRLSSQRIPCFLLCFQPLHTAASELLTLKPDCVNLLSQIQPMASIKLRIKPTLLSVAHRGQCDPVTSYSLTIPPPIAGSQPSRSPESHIAPLTGPAYSCLQVFGFSVPPARSSLFTDALLPAHSHLGTLTLSSSSLKPSSLDLR